MNKFMLSLLLTTAVSASSMNAQPDTMWVGKLAGVPMQVIHRNAYLLNGTVVPVLGAALLLKNLPAFLEGVELAPGTVFLELPLPAQAALLASLWAAYTYVGGTLTKSCAKGIMDAFDIPEQQL